LLKNSPLRHIIEGKTEENICDKKDEEEDTTSYWMTIRKRQSIGS
jgi:hypothetical protein